MPHLLIILAVSMLCACGSLPKYPSSSFARAMNQTVEAEAYADDPDKPTYNIQHFSNGELIPRAE